MKKLLLILVVLSSFSIVVAGNKANTKTEKQIKKELEKKAQAIQDSIDFIMAQTAIDNMEFIIPAERMSFKDGLSIYPDSNVNFISANRGRAVVQLSFPNGSLGLNGLGGITVEGMYSNIKKSFDKRGNMNIEFSVLGTAISARVAIFIAKDSNISTATVYPNFNSMTLTVYGKIIPIEQSNAFKGRTL